MSASQRTKGHSWEREVARRIREIMPGETIKRGLQTQPGVIPADVEMPVFHPECKIGIKPNMRKAIAQAQRDSKRGKVPIAIVKDDRKPAYVIMLMEDWLEMVAEWWKAGNR